MKKLNSSCSWKFHKILYNEIMKSFQKMFSEGLQNLCLRKTYKIYSKILCSFNLLRRKLEEAALCIFEQPTFDVEAQSLTSSPPTNKLTVAFK